MPCYKPLRGYRSKDRNPSGKRSIVFTQSAGLKDLPVELPCGQCIGCRLEKSRQWAIRCHHEASLHETNSFITLTYSPEHLPPGETLVLSHFQNFMKRLRKSTGQKIRYFMCGEYGEKFARPHYHACIFGWEPPDLVHWRTVNDQKYFQSTFLDKTWTHGSTITGDVTFESAAYVARYITKKVTGKNAEAHYTQIDLSTGEILEKKPEFTTMSRRPGIGRDWLTKFKSDVYPGDFVVVRGKKMKPPRFYNAQMERDYPLDYSKLKASRINAAKQHTEDQTWDRLKVREIVQIDRYEKLIRGLENDL